MTKSASNTIHQSEIHFLNECSVSKGTEHCFEQTTARDYMRIGMCINNENNTADKNCRFTAIQKKSTTTSTRDSDFPNTWTARRADITYIGTY